MGPLTTDVIFLEENNLITNFIQAHTVTAGMGEAKTHQLRTGRRADGRAGDHASPRTRDFFAVHFGSGKPPAKPQHKGKHADAPPQHRKNTLPLRAKPRVFRSATLCLDGAARQEEGRRVVAVLHAQPGAKPPPQPLPPLSPPPLSRRPSTQPAPVPRRCRSCSSACPTSGGCASSRASTRGSRARRRRAPTERTTT